MAHKLKLTILFFFLAFTNALAQSPNMINYQGVALNTGGTAIANQTISIRATVHQATATGTILYSEERVVGTDDGGLFDLQLGSPGAISSVGSWTAINWETGDKFLQIEMDAAGGTNFTNMGTQQLVSVPYAQYANKAGELIPTATINPNQINAGGATTNQVLKYDGTSWVPGADVSAFSLPFTGTDGSSQSFKITNTNTTGTAVKGECIGSSGIAIKGLSNGTSNQAIGVYGEATAGVGVSGYSNNGGSIAVNGYSIAGTGINGYSYGGTGVKAASNLGIALDVTGNTHLNGGLKINGGSTNPSQGAVLISDASGNAVWKNNKIGFAAKSIVNQAINHQTVTQVSFDETYDASGNFNPASAATDPSTFIAPVSGFYHFSARAEFYLFSNVYNLRYGSLFLNVNGVQYSRGDGNEPINSASGSDQYVDVNDDIHLNAGDKVTVSAYIVNLSSSAAVIDSKSFCGHIIYAD